MELKNYQVKILNDIERYLDILQEKRSVVGAFNHFWMTNTPPINPSLNAAVEPYKDNISGVPHLCVKVPTGGGKTIIASAALKRIFNAFALEKYKMVVWLVPSNSILEQTLRNLRNTQHPYRHLINTDFGNRVQVIDKQQALMGHQFTLNSVRENLTILVISYDSIRASNKEGRKVYQDNGNLQSFVPILDGVNSKDDELPLMSVLSKLRPVIIVDESHNTESKLSQEMIKELSPSFVLDLTATPRANSNIISFTDALELRKNQMVKLPIIVYNHHSKNEVIDSALYLQRQLEQKSLKEDRYIRPIVLFQAESRNGNTDRSTFDSIKRTLLNLNIPEEQIKIKTAEINELKDVDLMSEDCAVRYIITVNALKEGWDCPFAYILASLADRSSAIDVTQIVGRVLRLPYAKANNEVALNLSYVLTASQRFQDTLQAVVKGLNNAGFSKKDYRQAEVPEIKLETTKESNVDLFGIGTGNENREYKKDEYEITYRQNSGLEHVAEYGNSVKKESISELLNPMLPSAVDDILNIATNEAHKMEEKIKEQKEVSTPNDLVEQVKKGIIKDIFVNAKDIKLPVFVIKDGDRGIFGTEEIYHRLDSTHLLKDFKLKNQDATMIFNSTDTSVYKVDIDSSTNEHTPVYMQVANKEKNYLREYIYSATDKEGRINRIAGIVVKLLGRMDPLKDKDVLAYVKRVLEDKEDCVLDDFLDHQNEYAEQIKKKIRKLEDDYKAKVFSDCIDTNKIELQSIYSFPEEKPFAVEGNAIIKSLYTVEEQINSFETEVINAVANKSNVVWWTRNPSRTGFCINGYINHYPDFIIYTQKGNIILLETKGDQLDAEDKVKLGNKWALLAGSKYKYFLVYDRRDDVEGSYTKDKFLDLLSDL